MSVPSTPLATPWVERIFAHLSLIYGSRFLDMWRGVDADHLKAMWANKLGGFAENPEAIKLALDALDDKPQPPTLPEFLRLCRDAARRTGSSVPALGHKLSTEEIAHNKARLAQAIAVLHGARSTAARPAPRARSNDFEEA